MDGRCAPDRSPSGPVADLDVAPASATGSAARRRTSPAIVAAARDATRRFDRAVGRCGINVTAVLVGWPGRSTLGVRQRTGLPADGPGRGWHGSFRWGLV